MEKIARQESAEGEKRVTKKTTRTIYPSQLKQQRVCPLCGLETLEEQVRVMFPCSNKHTIHMQCLLSRENIRGALDECPGCEDFQKNCVITDKHTCLLKSYNNIKQSLNIGRSQDDILNQVKIGLIKTLAQDKYKTKVPEFESISIRSETYVGGYLSDLFNWGTGNKKKTENDDIGFTGSVLRMINAREKSTALYFKNVTWKDVIHENIDIETMFEKGYTILDFFILQATWEDLLTSGLSYDLFEKYKDRVDITSLIIYYHLNFIDIYKDLCESNFSYMAKIGLTFQDFVDMKFNVNDLRLKGLSAASIVNSDLYRCLTMEQWAIFDVKIEKYK